jgi:hypothetical protein
VGPSSRWSRTHEAVAHDPRARALDEGRREALFRALVSDAQRAEDAERAQRAKAREAERKVEAGRRAAEERQRQVWVCVEGGEGGGAGGDDCAV